MRIISVTIHNIASIEGPYTINLDQEPIGSVGLFAITGATGSGKSTVLDAVCLALYDNTPRLAPLSSKNSAVVSDGLNQLGIKDVRTLLRKGAVSGYCKVQFVGIDHKIYEAEWHVRRARNKTNGSIQPQNMLLTDLTDGIPFPDTRKSNVLEEIKRLVGLSFEQFTKAVILAQGEFTSFLKADDDTRAAILEKLTGTDIYRKISEEIFRKNKFFQQELEIIERQLQSFHLLSDDEKKELQLQLIKWTAEEKTQKENLTAGEKDLNWYFQKEELLLQIRLAEQHKTQATLRKEQQKERFLSFRNIERVQEIREEVIQRDQISAKIKETEEMLLETQKEWEQIRTQKEKKTLQKAEVQQRLQESQRITEKVLPEIKKARALDTVMAERFKILSDKKQEHKQKQEQLLYAQQALKKWETNLAEVNTIMKKITDWQQKNAQTEALHQHFSWMDTTIKEIEKQKKNSAEVQHQIHISEKELEVYSSKIRHIKEAIDEQQMIFKTQKGKAEKLKEKIKTLDFSNLNKEQTRLLYELETLEKDIRLIQEIHDLTCQYETESVAVLKIEEEQKRLDEEWKYLWDMLPRSEARLEVVKKLYDKTQLEHSANVKSLRSQLERGTPCPVCGALEHPYQSDVKDHAAWENIQNELKSAKEILEKQQTEYVVLQTKREARSEKRKDHHTRQVKIKEQLIYKQQMLEISPNFPVGQHFEKEELLSFIENKIANNKTVRAELEEKWQQFVQWKQDSEKEEQLLQQIQKELDILQSELKTLEDKHSLASHQRTASLLVFENYSLQIAGNESKINKVLDQTQWKEVWIKDLSWFKEQLHKATKNWAKSVENMAKCQQKSFEISTNISLNSKEIKKQQDAFSDSEKQMKALQFSYDELLNQRKVLLEGREADEVESELQKALKRDAEHLEQTGKEWQELVISETKCAAKINELKHSQMDFERQIKTKQKTIQQWISAHFDHNEEDMRLQINEWIQYDSRWISEERKKLKEIDDAVLTATTLLNDKKNALDLLLKAHMPAAEKTDTEHKITESKRQLEHISSQKSIIENQLLIDNREREKLEEVVKEQNHKKEIVAKWANLNMLLGSQDGKKFRKIAQEYTLDILLRYANVHLKEINKRYALERIPESLSLQVVDYEMGQDIRSVFSLSGGESFLVSLALALALSSLSSSRMNVETLFIDEGFGSLDASTLAIAMDALENLQYQGKKVGVISHVQEMTERIPVKILVKKQGNGTSSIVVKP